MLIGRLPVIAPIDRYVRFITINDICNPATTRASTVFIPRKVSRYSIFVDRSTHPSQIGDV
jgi:hypothetical protein